MLRKFNNIYDINKFNSLLCNIKIRLIRVKVTSPYNAHRVLWWHVRIALFVTSLMRDCRGIPIQLKITLSSLSTTDLSVYKLVAF